MLVESLEQHQCSGKILLREFLAFQKSESTFLKYSKIKWEIKPTLVPKFVNRSFACHPVDIVSFAHNTSKSVLPQNNLDAMRGAYD